MQIRLDDLCGGEVIALLREHLADIPAAFAKADPYVVNGLVSRWQVKPWHTVVGESAANPVKPEAAG